MTEDRQSSILNIQELLEQILHFLAENIKRDAENA